MHHISMRKAEQPRRAQAAARLSSPPSQPNSVMVEHELRDQEQLAHGRLRPVDRGRRKLHFNPCQPGPSQGVVDLQVRWPCGRIQRLGNVDVHRPIVITEEQGKTP